MKQGILVRNQREFDWAVAWWRKKRPDIKGPSFTFKRTMAMVDQYEDGEKSEQLLHHDRPGDASGYVLLTFDWKNFYEKLKGRHKS